MKILRYKYKGPTKEDWNFDELEFNRVNLFVGDTATGKTRLLNTIFNLGVMAVRENQNILAGKFDVTFEIDNKEYHWIIESCRNDENESELSFESLNIKKGDSYEEIIHRENLDFVFNGTHIPKMSTKKTSIVLLQNEELINPIFNDFGKIVTRKFSEDTLAVEREIGLVLWNMKQIEQFQNLENVFKGNIRLNQKLFILKKYHNEIFREISDWYKRIFPFVDEVDVKNITDIEEISEDNSIAPAFCIKEKKGDKWIFIPDFSSGMLKILLLLVDVMIIPNGGISIIDEYENSLGINSIGFLPSLIYELEKDNQFFISSHHPYIINEIPIENWYIFHRENMNVSILHGQKVIERYGKSNQSAFIKLINDDFYSQGIG